MRAKELRKGLLIGVLILIAFWLISLILGLVGRAKIAVLQANDAKTQYESLEKRKNILKKNLNTLATPLGKDAAIRTAFGVARTGEEVIVVVPPRIVTPTTTPSWWQRILSWF